MLLMLHLRPALFTLACLVGALMLPTVAAASCLSPRGDVDQSGGTNVTDVQCMVLVSLWELAGQTGPQPVCLKVSLLEADMNCDGLINIADVQIVVRHALSIPLVAALDADQNGCVDICELDSDGDGDGDFLDCAPYNAAISSSATEVCNGYDDSCSGVVDDSGAASVAASCQNGDLCDGQEQCAGQPTNLGLMIHEIMIDPDAVPDNQGEWVELYNPTPNPIDINGWTIRNNISVHIINNQGPLRVPPGRYLVLGRNANPAQNGGFNLQYVYPAIELNNTSDSVRLLNPAGVEVDRVDYTAAGFGLQPGRSIALKNPALNNNLASSWALSTASMIGMAGLDKGTPKGPNIDVFEGTTCTDGPDLVCNDGINCTIDGCDPATGCTVVANNAACNDNIACTVDSCDVASGCVFAPNNAACDDTIACTTDVCSATLGCVITPVNAVCDDGIACTTDVCSPTQGCVLTPVNAACNDGIACTTDTCDPAMGCMFAPQNAACDDGVACTMDTCDAAVGCVSTPNNGACDDGIACTADSCHPTLGCVNAPNNAACNDDIACTQDTCDPATGCVFAPNHTFCDDNVACTDDVCSPLTGCANTANNALCNDSVACTIDVCDPVTGCGFTASDALCNDGDPCTIDTCNAAQGCQYAALNTPECTSDLEGDEFCAVSGTAGTTALCPIRLVRFNQMTPPAAALSFAIGYDPLLVAPSRLLADVCFGPGGTPPCITTEVPPDQLSSGHTVIPAPASLALWNGVGSVFLAHFSDPSAAINTAYLQGSAPVGDTIIATLEVTLLADVGVGAPSTLEFGNIQGSTGDVKPLTGSVLNGLMVVSVAKCNEYPGVCDDGDACTADSCNASTGACSFNPLVCDDGDACNGLETCNPASGCVAGAAPNCNDGIACTADSCDPALGCVNAPDNAQCDDGVACTDNACVPGTGCVYTANNANCDDAVGCTIDICSPTTGCSNTASDAACDDGFACTTEMCDPLLDCQFTTDDSQCDVDDGNPCTAAACVVGAGCAQVVLPADECLPNGALCALSGAAGAQVLCPIRVARATQGTPAAAALQFAVSYNAAQAMLTGAQDQLCLGVGNTPPCVDQDTPPDNLSPSGHAVIPAPSNFASWAGTGTFFLVNFADPSSELNDAYLLAGNFVGHTQVMELKFTLAEAIDAQSPLYVTASNITGSTATVTPLLGAVEAGTIILAAADCNALAGSCDDGNPCTVDTCVTANGTCSYQVVSCSDGNACNGLETCIPLIGCQPGPAPVCDDGQSCTTESCNPATGCEYVANHAACDDDIACTTDSCAPFEGCTNAPVDVACNDGVPCTMDVCSPLTGCSNTASDALCDDGAACSTGICDANLGCQFALDHSACEDDGNPCTLDTCVVGVGCAHVPSDAPECQDPDAICLLSGSAGAEVLCPLRLARATEATPLPTALQLALEWDGSKATAQAFQTEVCFGEPAFCVPLDAPPDNLNPSGHTVIPAPGDVTSWAGAGSVIFLHTSEPSTALSTAYKQNGVVVGASQFVALRFVLIEEVSSAAPLAVYATSIQASTAGVALMTGQVEAGVMVVGLANCALAPMACNDGNPCTADMCNPSTGACEYSPTACNDGNACNGMESCIPWVGCVLGAPPACDDGAACTSDSCDPASGCVYAPNNAACNDGVACTVDTCAAFAGCTFTPSSAACDDGVACTMDACDPVSGCSNTPSNAACDDGIACTSEVCVAGMGCEYTANNGACDDGDACTVDTCSVGMGCFHTLTADVACIPDGALCAISGMAGDIVVCPLRLARATEATPPAAALTFDLAISGAGAQPLMMRDEFCLDASTCFEMEVPPNPLYPSGHTVVVGPSQVPSWMGQGTVAIFHAADPTAEITDAFRTAGAISGDPVFAELVFQLTQDVSGYSPVLVVPSNIIGATASVAALAGEVWQGTMLTGTTSCAASPGICDDGNACTTDSCNAATGQCEYAAAVVCDDGDVCNGMETCNPLSGECVAGEPLTCDDGIECTDDACDPMAGCQFLPDHGACPADGQPCSTALCYPPMNGCINAPNLEGACLPGGAVCAVYGVAGGEGLCGLELARATQGSGSATALQFALTYNNALLGLEGLRDEVCFDLFCFEVSVPPDALHPSGHSAILAPTDPAEWIGTGSIFLVNFAEPTAAITEAYKQGGAVVGDAKFADAVFRLKAAVSPFAPVYVYASSILGTATGLDSLNGAVQDGVMVTSP